MLVSETVLGVIHRVVGLQYGRHQAAAPRRGIRILAQILILWSRHASGGGAADPQAMNGRPPTHGRSSEASRTAALVLPLHPPMFGYAFDMLQSLIWCGQLSRFDVFLVFSSDEDRGRWRTRLSAATSNGSNVLHFRRKDEERSLTASLHELVSVGLPSTEVKPVTFKKLFGLEHVFHSTSHEYAIALDADAVFQSTRNFGERLHGWARSRTVFGSSGYTSPGYEKIMNASCAAVGLQAPRPAGSLRSPYLWWSDAPIFERRDAVSFLERMKQTLWWNNNDSARFVFDHAAYLCFLIQLKGWHLHDGVGNLGEATFEEASSAQQAAAVREAASNYQFTWSRDPNEDRLLQFHVDRLPDSNAPESQRFQRSRACEPEGSMPRSWTAPTCCCWKHRPSHSACARLCGPVSSYRRHFGDCRRMPDATSSSPGVAKVTRVKQRVLLALIGQARTFRLTAPRLFDLVIRPNEADHEFDIAVHTDFAPASCATACAPKNYYWVNFTTAGSAQELDAALRTAYGASGQVKRVDLSANESHGEVATAFAWRILRALAAAHAIDVGYDNARSGGRASSAIATGTSTSASASVVPFAFCIVMRLDVVLVRELLLQRYASRLIRQPSILEGGGNGIYSITSNHTNLGSHDHHRDTDYVMIGSAACLATLARLHAESDDWKSRLRGFRTNLPALERLRNATGLLPGRPRAALFQNYSIVQHRKLMYLWKHGCGLDVRMFADDGIFAAIVRPGGEDIFGRPISDLRVRQIQ